MKKLFGNYKQLCSYVFWGTGTTIVNFTVFFLCTKLFHIHHLVSNGIAWVLAVTYAFISTKLLVFASKSWHPSIVFKELFGFVSARLLSGIVETTILFIFIDCLHVPKAGLVKLIATVIVVTINYVSSKLLIFRNK